MSNPQRRRSKDLPPDLSELMNRLIAAAASFIQMVNENEPRMRDIVEEFRKLHEEVKNMQEWTDRARTRGAVTLFGVCVIAAPFTGGFSLLGAGAAAAGASVVGSNLMKIWHENAKAEEVKKQGEEFMQIVKPLKEKLEEIKTICDKLEQESSKILATQTLEDVEKLEFLLQKVKMLQKKSEGVLAITVTVKNAVLMLVSIFRLTATPEADEKLRNSIIEAADQSKMVTDDFGMMGSELKEFVTQ